MEQHSLVTLTISREEFRGEFLSLFRYRCVEPNCIRVRADNRQTRNKSTKKRLANLLYLGRGRARVCAFGIRTSKRQREAWSKARHNRLRWSSSAATATELKPKPRRHACSCPHSCTPSSYGTRPFNPAPRTRSSARTRARLPLLRFHSPLLLA